MISRFRSTIVLLVLSLSIYIVEPSHLVGPNRSEGLAINGSNTPIKNTLADESHANTGNAFYNLTGQVIRLQSIIPANLSSQPYPSSHIIPAAPENPYVTPPGKNLGAVKTNAYTIHPTITQENSSAVGKSSAVHIGPSRMVSDGFNYFTSKCNCTPPDVQIARGPDNFQVEIVNVAVSISKMPNCNPNCTTGIIKPLEAFFGLPAGSRDIIGDPKLLYDSMSHRWVASVSDFDTDSVRLAVSSTSNPNDAWTIYEFPFSACADQPILGLNDKMIAISANLITNHCGGTFMGVKFILVNKDDLLNGVRNPKSFTFDSTSPIISPTIFSLHPVHTIQTNSPLVIVGLDHSNTGIFLSVYAFTLQDDVPQNAGCQPCRIQIQSTNPPLPTQPGTDVKLDIADDRIQDATLDKNKLWIAFDVGPDSSGSGCANMHSCIRIIQFGVTGNIPTIQFALDQNFDIQAQDADLFFPALRVDNEGNLIIVFGVSSTTIFPSVMSSTQRAGDLNTISEPSFLGVGTTADTSNSASSHGCTCSYYGDYFSAAIDPITTKIWVAGEYMKQINATSSYSTIITNIE